MSIISYPTPLYQNPPIEFDDYSPQRYNISAISLDGQTITVTTSVDHDYVVGQQVRLIIPVAYGSRQLNETQGYVLSIPADDQVLLDIPSYNVDAFIDAGTGAGAQILAIGDINSGQQSSTGNTGIATYVPGSFRNVSP
jgi:hypothetical protein